MFIEYERNNKMKAKKAITSLIASAMMLSAVPVNVNPQFPNGYSQIFISALTEARDTISLSTEEKKMISPSPPNIMGYP